MTVTMHVLRCGRYRRLWKSRGKVPNPDLEKMENVSGRRDNYRKTWKTNRSTTDVRINSGLCGEGTTT